MHIDFPKLQFLRERVLDRFRIHACRTTEFRTGRKNPIGNHDHDETTLPARPCGDELIESDVSHGAEHSRDIPMRQASVTLRTLMNSPICRSSPATLRASVGFVLEWTQVFIGVRFVLRIIHFKRISTKFRRDIVPFGTPLQGIDAVSTGS